MTLKLMSAMQRRRWKQSYDAKASAAAAAAAADDDDETTPSLEIPSTSKACRHPGHRQTDDSGFDEYCR